MVEKIVQKEVESTEKLNRLFKLPKHIKQIGMAGNSPEIYIEDYAEGYLKRLAGNDCEACRIAVLVGEFIKTAGKRYVFIRGAIEAEDAVDGNEVKFTSEVWAEVYEKIKRYFPQYEAVGWFLGGPEYLTEVTDRIRQIHTDWFGGRDRVLYKVDPVEKETAFYLYDKGELKEWPGYCIYYEKNEEMQDYMVAGAPPSVDAGYKEPILAELGKRVGRKAEEPDRQEAKNEIDGEEEGDRDEKKEQKPKSEKKQGKSSSGHGLGIVAAMALLAVGAVAVRERELRRAMETNNPTAAATVTPTGIGIIEEPVDVVSVPVVATPTEGIPVTAGAEHTMLAGEFIPITEEPFIPEKAPEEVTATPAEEVEKPAEPEQEEVLATDNLKLYVVQDGDTLAGICRAFYGSIHRMEEVKGINQIPDENRIYAGQELYLP
ncbi:MAG: LysM peptidoglycan-binding domain-containing protein [Lachnospiraceae bacterium]|nr:LysM peptidoglycan-binding domain-containing protein [Lachnospiraceae bacterium]